MAVVFIILDWINVLINTTTMIQLAAAWLAQLVERQSAVRKVEGSSSRQDQHSLCYFYNFICNG